MDYSDSCYMKKNTYIKLPGVKKQAKNVAHTLRGGEIFALTGELGSGKTTFVKAVTKTLGLRKTITSPTFTLMNHFIVKPGVKNSFTLPINIYHLDLYRTKSFREVAALGITEVWGKKDTIVFIEWADKIKKHLPKNTHYIHFSHE